MQKRKTMFSALWGQDTLFEVGETVLVLDEIPGLPGGEVCSEMEIDMYPFGILGLFKDY